MVFSKLFKNDVYRRREMYSIFSSGLIALFVSFFIITFTPSGFRQEFQRGRDLQARQDV